MLETNLHCKPTDKHQYLHAKSCHPRRCKDAIPFGLTRRLQRICSQEVDLHSNIEVMKGHLARRGYNRDKVQTEVDRALLTPRAECLKLQDKHDTDRVPFPVTYHPMLPNLHEILCRHHNLLTSSQKLSAVFQEPPLVSYRRPKNLRDLLVHAELKQPSNVSKGPGTLPCGGRGCKTCPSLIPNNSKITSHSTGQTWPVWSSATCKSSDLVYLVQCRKCGKQYVGETKQPLHHRLNSHRSDINTKKLENKPVAQHFNQPHHNASHLSICVIELLSRGDDVICRTHESRWIRQLDTMQPSGMNLRVDGL